MRLGFLGGAMEIGGSCILLESEGKRILMDAGIRQGGAKDPVPDFRRIPEWGGLDAIVVSHAHMDHIGTLPVISKAYPGAPIYMTRMTMDLTMVLLRDSLKIMGRWEEEIPHYAEKDVLDMMDRLRPVSYQVPVEILEDVKLTFYPAGHIAGAACAYVQGKEGSVFYSGDFCGFSQRAIEGIRIPKLRPDVAVVESTYGDRLHSNRQVEEKALVDLAAECIEKKGKMLIPAFALGRSQEVLLILKSAMEKGLIPRVRVYVDGMVRDINTAFLRNPTYLKSSVGRKILRGFNPFEDDWIQPVKPLEDRDKLLDTREPVIIISSSGMLTGGPSVQYARKIASMEDGYIVITGYQDEEAPGRQLQNAMTLPEGERALSLGGVRVLLKCRLASVGLSAHGDKSEILGLVERLTPRNVFLVHGDMEAVHSLGEEMALDFRGRVCLPECGETYELEIRNKRKQITQPLPFSMQRGEPFEEAQGRMLWNYWQEHYAGRAFMAQELAFLWWGRHCGEEEAEELKRRILKSIYFEMNPKRLYLIQARKAEDIEKDLLPKEITPQELAAAVKELFADYPVKKISYLMQEKRVRLNFDFPHVLPDHMDEACREFEARTGFSVDRNDTMNLNEAGLLLARLFGQRLLKVSYFGERRCVRASLTQWDDEDRSAAETFRRTTGWNLDLGRGGEPAAANMPDVSENTAFGKVASGDAAFGNLTSGDAAFGNLTSGDAAFGNLTSGNIVSENTALGSTEGGRMFFPQTKEAGLEQNLALQCVDYSFEGEPHRPYKKGVKTDSSGKYIELSFLSPELGRRYASLLQEISDQIGWRIAISESVNQIEVMNRIRQDCSEMGIVLTKNPSYRPVDRLFELFIAQGGEKAEELSRRVFQETGCRVGLR